MSPGRPDGLADSLPLVAAEVVHHHHIAWAQGRDEHMLDVGPKGFTVDRAVQDKRRVDPVVAQCRDEGHGAPVSMWCATDQTFALRSPAAQRGHVRLGPCLVDEDQTAGVDPPLVPLPPGAAAAHVGAVLLLGKLRLFLNV